VTAPPSESIDRGRIWFAQALRGLAAALVVWGHLGDVFFTSHPLMAARVLVLPLHHVERPPWEDFIDRVFAYHGINTGSLGIALFFLVSGFVIPFSLERGTLAQFFARRFFRLYPTLWVCLTIVAVTLAIWAADRGTAYPYGSGEFLANGSLINIYTRHRSLLFVEWTLAIEELFYLLAALLAWKRRLASPVAILGLGAALTVISASVGHGLTQTSGSYDLRYWLSRTTAFVIFILVGTALHNAYRKGWPARVTVPVVGSLLLMFDVAIHEGSLIANPEFAYFENALFALMIFAVLLTLNERLPRPRALNWMADVSYPLYLVHATLGTIVAYAVYEETRSISLTVATAIGASYVVAWLVHQFVEQPSIALGRRVSERLGRGERPAADFAPSLSGKA